MDATDLLRKVLNRLKKDEYSDILKEWDYIDMAYVDFKGAKRSIVSQVVGICANQKIEWEDVGEVDLLYLHKHSTSMVWTVYQLTRQQGNKGAAKSLVSPASFSQNLKKHISLYYKSDVNVQLHNGAFWIRICIHDGVKLSPADTVYVVHYPRSAYIIVSRVKVAYKDYIMQSLLSCLKCSQLKELQLTGRHVESLARIVLNKDCGSLGHLHRTDPLDHRLPRKRKLGELEEDLDDRLVCEERTEKEAILDKTAETFGEGKQPLLEKMEYRLETRFRGTRFAPEMATVEAPFRCKIKFEGNSVLEGMKKLGPAGVASLPLPHYISKLKSLATNYIVIGDKNQATTPGNTQPDNE